MRVKKRYQRSRNHYYLVLEKEKLYREDYQVRMILENEIKGLLSVQARGMDEKSYFFYDITGKESLKKQYKKKTILQEEITTFLKELFCILEALYEHMLDASSLLIRPEYIFQNSEQSYFCYCPYEKRNVCKDFHKFTEFLVSQIDYEDRGSIRLAHELHKKTLAPQYDLMQLIKDILSKVKEQEDEREETKMKEMEAQMVCEEITFHDNRYQTRDTKKKKRGKWGDWKAFEVEEENDYKKI